MSGRLIFQNRYDRRNGDVSMPKILVLGKQAQFRTLLSESLWLEGHLVESVADAAMLWDHLGNSQPDLVLLDANSDGFGTCCFSRTLNSNFQTLASLFIKSEIPVMWKGSKGQSMMPW